MKKFWLVLLSLGLVMVFSVSAFAVDVKVSGEYYVAGMYLNKATLNDTVYGTGAFYGNTNTAFFYQRLRMGTDFIVSPGLKLVTRYDVMERIWGGARSAPGTSLDTLSAGTRAENENIAFDLLYVSYESPIGLFKVGYQLDSAWGTIFMDSANPRGTVAWSYTNAPWWFYLGFKKFDDKSNSAVTNTTQTDLDRDKFALAVKYTGKSAEGGLLGGWVRDARSKTASTNATNLVYYLQPYAIAQIGPVKVQTELDYFWGDYPKYDSTDANNKRLELWAGWIDATANFGTFYAGGTVAYVAGDDPSTTDKIEGLSGLVNGGIDWNPCLIMFNNDITYWGGGVSGYDATTTQSQLAGPMYNAWFGQGRVGVKPTPQLDAMLSVSYAAADKKPSGFDHSSYGWEVDLTGTYKISNNLSYMLGAGYLFTGDYFKGYDGSRKVDDDYLVINKLTLTF